MTAHAILPIDRDVHSEFVRWIAAGAAVLAVHLGLIAGYWLFKPLEPQGEADAPAVIIDLAPLTVAPTIQRQDIGPGPELVQPEPKVQQPKPDQKPDQPKLELAPTINPLVTLPEPKPEVKLEEKPQEPLTQQQTAPPKAERTAPVAAAARIGSNTSNVVPPAWVSQLLAHLNRHKQYPSAARARHEEGIVTLSFTMDRDGHVLARNIVKSSGSHALDAEALAMLQRAEPLPAFPPSMAGASRSFSVPIRFSLR
jgi:periplasmic protein TonB